MSHYTVTIVLPEAPVPRAANEGQAHVEEMIGTLLAPFDENEEVEAYKEHVRPLPEHWRHATQRELGWPYVMIRDEAPEVDLEDPAAVAAFMNARYGEDGGEPEYHVDEQGLYQMSTYNPNSKWDWWALGGRWTGIYKLRPGAITGIVGRTGVFGDPAPAGHVDVARKGDIDTENCNVVTYAVLAEGVWRAPGDMGWFGMSSEEEAEQQDYEKWFQEFWDGLGDDVWLAVVDLHI